MKRVSYRAAALLGIMTAFAGCDSLGLGDGPEGVLEDNRQRWEAQALTSYEYVIRRLCFCGFVGEVRIRVVDGVVTERTIVESGDPLPPGTGDSYPDVDGLFEVLADAYAQDAHSVRVTYDPATGVPLEISIDYQENVIDEELGYTVSSLPSGLP